MKVDLLLTYFGYNVFLEIPYERKDEIPFLQSNFKDFVKSGEFIEWGNKAEAIKKIGKRI